MPQPEGRKSQKPVLLSADEARAFLTARKPDRVTLLDVRQPDEYEESHLPGARLSPLPGLADAMAGLEPDLPVMTYCRSGRRSAAAASLLAGNGFTTFDIAGGIMAWNGHTASGSEDTGMIVFPENPDPATILGLAYGMEDALAAGYRRLAEQTPDPEVAAMLTKLAGFEDKHKNLIEALYRKAGEPEGSLDSLAKRFPPRIESGRSLDEYLFETGGDPADPVEVIELAMQIEAQALDLYLRYARAYPSDAEETFMRLAREEQGHLTALANLLKRDPV